MFSSGEGGQSDEMNLNEKQGDGWMTFVLNQQDCKKEADHFTLCRGLRRSRLTLYFTHIGMTNGYSFGNATIFV